MMRKYQISHATELVDGRQERSGSLCQNPSPAYRLYEKYSHCRAFIDFIVSLRYCKTCLSRILSHINWEQDSQISLRFLMCLVSLNNVFLLIMWSVMFGDKARTSPFYQRGLKCLLGRRRVKVLWSLEMETTSWNLMLRAGIWAECATKRPLPGLAREQST